MAESNPNPPVFIALPTHDDRYYSGTVKGIITASKKHNTIPGFGTCGSLCQNFNQLLVAALILRKEHGIKWFAMLHSDVEPEPGWIDMLIDEAEETGADLMSAAVAIKDMRGVTSTALSNPDNPWAPYTRLTVQQLNHDGFPKTFDTAMVREALANLPEGLREDVPEGSRLQNNVGCCVYDLDKWQPGLTFDVFHRIAEQGGNYRAEFQSDDWIFSDRLHDAGQTVWSTTKVATTHFGAWTYRNDHTWGNPSDVDAKLIRESNASGIIDIPASEHSEALDPAMV